MPIFDLHADSLVKAYENDYSLKDSKQLQVNLEKIIKENYYCQCFAIFVNDSENEPFTYYKKVVEFYNKYIENAKINNVSKGGVFINNKVNAVLTVENACVIGNDLSKIDVLQSDGVKMVTLVWNNENNLAYSHKDAEKGLKPFGYECIEKFNELGIIVDLSHISQKGFNQACLHSKKPIVASHSNSKSVCNNSRNLSDENLRLLAENGGVVGINFYPPFISTSKSANYLELLGFHVNQIKKVAGIDSISIGSDFDGIEKTCIIDEPNKIEILIKYLKGKGFTSSEIDKISYKNAIRVFQDNKIEVK